MALPSNTEEEVEFDWLQLHHDMEKLISTETAKDKLVRKFKENPLVPIGKKNVTKNNIQEISN